MNVLSVVMVVLKIVIFREIFSFLQFIVVYLLSATVCSWCSSAGLLIQVLVETVGLVC